VKQLQCQLPLSSLAAGSQGRVETDHVDVDVASVSASVSIPEDPQRLLPRRGFFGGAQQGVEAHHVGMEQLLHRMKQMESQLPLQSWGKRVFFWWMKMGNAAVNLVKSGQLLLQPTIIGCYL
jgi:hypothetical protein